MNRAQVAAAGHTGDVDLALAALTDTDPTVRATALGALRRCVADGADNGIELLDAIATAMVDDSPIVRRRAVELAAHITPPIDVTALLDDPDWSVAEMAAWACGELGEAEGNDETDADDSDGDDSDGDDNERGYDESDDGDEDEGAAHRQHVTRCLARVATDHTEPLVREAAVAALGALGHPAGLAAILSATTDKPAVRRRAIIALTPFEGPDVDAALERALTDRDWQVREAAEELLR